MPEPPSAKGYFDMIRGAIEHSGYTERRFLLTYPFSDLKDYRGENTRVCSPIDRPDRVPAGRVLHLHAGRYLSVFYTVAMPDASTLQDLHVEIERYLHRHGLVPAGDTVLEEEHPEFSVVLPEGAQAYELQVAVAAAHR